MCVCDLCYINIINPWCNHFFVILDDDTLVFETFPAPIRGAGWLRL